MAARKADRPAGIERAADALHARYQGLEKILEQVGFRGVNMLALIAAVVIGQAAAPHPAPVPDVRQLKPSSPKVLAEIDTVKVQGLPVGLAWNADGTIYLRVTTGVPL